jgi:signal transduction histidine kinase
LIRGTDPEPATPYSWLQDLTTESRLGDLPSHECSVSVAAVGRCVAGEFERRPELPGVIVVREGASPERRLVAMLSRGVFFQRLSRPYSREIYLNRPIQILLDDHLPIPLVLAADTRIADAAVHALDRPTEHAYEPVVVRTSTTAVGPATAAPADDLRLIDVYVLLRAQAQLLGVAQAAMLQSEKLASLGQLAAGVAHEINNPLAFVSNNLAVLQRDARELAGALALCLRAGPVLTDHAPDLWAELSDLDERIDLRYTAENLPDLANRSREGLRRIQEIVKDLREFARLDIGEETDVDLNSGVTSTANIIAGRAKAADVRIELDLAPVPAVPGNPGKINQVVMNLLANAVEACHAGGRVTARTRCADHAVRIEVEDTGDGIDPAIANRLFDPFFTTKPPGHGTGLGLTISYGIVRDHGGAIDFVTRPGKGSIFRVLLPLEHQGRAVHGSTEGSPRDAVGVPS